MNAIVIVCVNFQVGWCVNAIFTSCFYYPQVAIKAAVSVGFSYIAVNFCSFLFQTHRLLQV